MAIKPIRGKADYERALRRVKKLRGSPKGSARRDERDILATLIEAYERGHHPNGPSDPIEAIKSLLEQKGKNSDALIGVVGHRARVYEVMHRQRPLSINMIRSVHKKFGIPAEVLIRPSRRKRRGRVRRRRARLTRRRMKLKAKR